MNDFYRSDDNKEQTSNTILRSVENMPEFGMYLLHYQQIVIFIKAKLYDVTIFKRLKQVLMR